MREHRFDAEEAALRPKAARLEDPVSDLQGHAAAESRPDVLGQAGLLGLQRAVGNGSVASIMDETPESVVPTGGGRPLDPDTRADMESRLGAEFGDVRVHDDGAAHSSARSVNAHAYTVGSNIVFQRDRYDPGSDSGRLMLAHELTHVVQQRQGPVDGTPNAAGVRVSDPSDRFERDAVSNAERVMATPPAAQPSPTPAPAAVVQRDAVDDAPVQRQEAEEDEEESAQTFVQREEAAEEEEEQQT